MILKIHSSSADIADLPIKTMHIDRKKVFSDRLQWDVLKLYGRYEIDQFDSEDATYIIVADDEGSHLASARLLPTSKHHILGSIFPYLCEGPVPVADDIFEITRFCLSPSQSARHRLLSRKRLVTALAEHGVNAGISAYTGVAEKFWYDQIASFGWACSPLGAPSSSNRNALVALRIEVNEQTLPGLRQGDMHAETFWQSSAWGIAA